MFINACVSLMIVALVLFFIVRWIAKLRSLNAKQEAVAAPDKKDCPRCLSSIHLQATRCPACTSELGTV